MVILLLGHDGSGGLHPPEVEHGELEMHDDYCEDDALGVSHEALGVSHDILAVNHDACDGAQYGAGETEDYALPSSVDAVDVVADGRNLHRVTLVFAKAAAAHAVAAANYYG